MLESKKALQKWASTSLRDTLALQFPQWSLQFLGDLGVEMYYEAIYTVTRCILVNYMVGPFLCSLKWD